MALSLHNVPQDYPDWSFDGSSTGQAEGNNSDRILEYASLANATAWA